MSPIPAQALQGTRGQGWPLGHCGATRSALDGGGAEPYAGAAVPGNECERSELLLALAPKAPRRSFERRASGSLLTPCALHSREARAPSTGRPSVTGSPSADPGSLDITPSRVAGHTREYVSRSRSPRGGVPTRRGVYLCDEGWTRTTSQRPILATPGDQLYCLITQLLTGCQVIALSTPTRGLS